MSHQNTPAEERYREELDRREALRERGPGALEPGKDDEAVNPYIPMYISKTPWYLQEHGQADKSKISLQHQRKQESESSMDQWYERGTADASSSVAPKKFRKGACENCGSMTHKTKFCVERPRKKGARWTGQDLRPDERVQSLELSFDAKRDRWNGYDPATQKRILDEWNQVEEERRALKEREDEERRERERLAAAATAEAAATNAPGPKLVSAGNEIEDDLAALSDSDGDDQDDEFKYAEKAQSIGQEVDKKSRITVRNLRIREDTARYLRPESGPTTDPSASENFVKANEGEAKQFSKVQTFAWDAAERGLSVHVQADPTRAEFLHRQHAKQQQEASKQLRKDVLEKYGGEEYLKSIPKDLIIPKDEHLSELRRDAIAAKASSSGNGDATRGRAVVRSRYPEDQFEKYGKGHTSVWGSYYDREQGKWGYACCHGTYKNGFCTGDAGIAADKDKIVRKLPDDDGRDKSLQHLHLEKMVQDIKEQKRKRENTEE